ncbi:MAG: hypothetical protein LBV70_07270 [Candidatus Adiutrix sp.]|jgi:hypothetical protein|nr:hypothetical protein [Candidatus Adiutrix sp.]
MSKQTDFGRIIIRSRDNSFVIDNGTYHVPHPSAKLPEFYDLWRRVEAYAKANPQMADVEEPPPQPQPAQREAALKAALQARLDGFARTRGYDGILSAASYAASTDPRFAAEGQYAIQARDETWRAALAVFAQVAAGEREMPAVAGFMAELPELAWPGGPDSEG